MLRAAAVPLELLRRARALQAKGYEFHLHFRPDTQVAQQADVSISGVSVGKVVKIKLIRSRTSHRRDDQARLSLRPDPKDARAMVRQKTLLGETYIDLTPGTKKRAMRSARGRHAPARPGRAERRARGDSSAPSMRRPARLQIWFRASAGSRAAARTSTRVRQPPALRRGTPTSCSCSSTRRRRAAAADPQHGRGLRRAVGARDAAARPDRQLQRVLQGHRQEQPAARRLLPGVPTFEKESTLTLERLNQSPRERQAAARGHPPVRPRVLGGDADVEAIAPTSATSSPTSGRSPTPGARACPPRRSSSTSSSR